MFMGMFPPEAMLMSVACTATKGTDGVCGSCWPCKCPWSVFPLMSVVCVITKDRVDACDLCCC